MQRMRIVFGLLAIGASAAVANVFNLQERKSAFWCWQPVTVRAAAPVKDAAWVQSPIDQYILAKMEAAAVAPAAPADRRTLIRRATFDVTGLPPVPADVEAFVNDGSPDAFAKVVDRLLGSEHFGEHWARHWMDVVRYAESRGHEFDPLIPNAWQYRDYLIRAFNADVPYNQLVTEQLAGDLMEHPRLNPEKGFNESILGTGFWFLGEEIHSPVDIRQDEADRMNNRVDTLSKAFLGLTVACARCHDHKFDAISQKDFYALQGFALSAGYRQIPFMSMEPNRKTAERLEALRNESAPRLVAALVAAERPQLGHVAEYLSAAREAMSAEHPGQKTVADVAVARSLNPALLGEWVRELDGAKKNPAALLHAFAELAVDRSLSGPEAFGQRRQDLAAQLNARRAEQQKNGFEQVLLDYQAEGQSSAWFADGVAFGLHPVRVGQVLLGDSIDHPVLGVAEHAMAQRDTAFSDLHPTPGNETDYGDLGGWNRAGQTLRTPSVTLKSGRMWYLVRGAGRAYAVVDSHLMVAGPLHGQVLTRWSAEHRGDWRWVSHDLTAYVGQRCHIEFSPSDRGTMEVAKVVESAQQPPAPDHESALLAPQWADTSINSIETLAAAYGKLLTVAADRLSNNTIVGSADAADEAPAADLLLRRPELFIAEPLDVAYGGENKRFVDAQQVLSRQVIHESPTAMAMWEGNGIDENLLVRGVAKNAADPVPRGMLEAIAGDKQKSYPADSSGRLQLAQSILDDSDPFASRVMVNRVWQHLFGTGIVPTVDNFGVLGQRPTHPELLDYLAEHFRTDQAWSVKRLIRSIMLTSTYQMSCKSAPGADQADPQNLLLHHMPVRRLEAESIRDAILSVSGRLDASVGGPPVEVHVTEYMDGRGKPSSGPLDGAGRRSIYTRIRRNFLSPMMSAFDTPNPFACVGRRNVSNVPAQALILMNDPFVQEQAQLWAKHVLAEPNRSAADRIGDMYRVALSRAPRPDEVDAMTKFMSDQGENYGLPAEQRMTDPRVWADLCHVMLNMKEFIFVQ